MLSGGRGTMYSSVLAMNIHFEVNRVRYTQSETASNCNCERNPSVPILIPSLKKSLAYYSNACMYVCMYALPPTHTAIYMDDISFQTIL